MNNQGTVILRGRVGSDLRSMTTQSGTKGIRFRLAASQWRINDSGKYVERDPHWYTVCVWDRLAKNLLSSVEKGTPIIVSGRPSARAWIGSDSEARAELVINASFCGIDLAFGPAAVMKPKIPQHNVQESATVEAGSTPHSRIQKYFLLTAAIAMILVLQIRTVVQAKAMGLALKPGV